MMAVPAPLSISILAVVILLLLVLSFLFSEAETALFSLSFRDLNSIRTKPGNAWKRITRVLEEPRMLMAALLISNGLVNIAIIIVSNLFLDSTLFIAQQQGLGGWLKLLIKIPLIGFFIIVFGEILPKIRATHNKLRAAYEVSYLAHFVFHFFKGWSERMLVFSDNIEKLFGGIPNKEFSQQQVDEAIKSTVTEEEEQKLLSGIYKFQHITVKQIMRTRLDVSGIEKELNFDGLKKRIEELHYSRLPVYNKSLDHIIGMIHTKDVLAHIHEKEAFDWLKLVRAPYFVHEQKYIEDLLKEFQLRRTHFAVVVDEFGGTSGIVTMEDILEEIIGDIRDEFDEDELSVKKLEEHSFLIEGRLKIHEACIGMGIAAETFNQVKGDSDSIAGLMLELAGEIPKSGDVLFTRDYQFTIIEVDRNRIQKVKASLLNPKSE